MSKTILFLVFLSLTAFVYTETQQEADPSAQSSGQATMDPEQQLRLQQQEVSMKRTACLVLSRYHSNANKDAIELALGDISPDQQQKYINKMYATAIEHCMPKITIDQAQKFFVEDPNFSADQMFYIYEGFDYQSIDYSTFTKNQQNLVKFIKNFDEEMQVRKQEREAEQDIDKQSSFDMKFFGLSSQQIPDSAKYVYLLIFAVLVGGSIYYLMSKIEVQDKSKSSKKRKSPGKNTSTSPTLNKTSSNKSAKKQ